MFIYFVWGMLAGFCVFNFYLAFQLSIQEKGYINKQRSKYND